MDSRAGVEWLVPVVFEVLVAPVQGPQTGGPGVVQACDREAGPVGSKILAPRRPAFANGQMPWGDVAFDADLAADLLEEPGWGTIVGPGRRQAAEARRSCGHDRSPVSQRLSLCRCEQRRLLDPIERFGRGDPAEHPPGAVVEFGRDSVEVVLGE